MADSLALPSDSLSLIQRANELAAQVSQVVAVLPLETPQAEAQAAEVLRGLATLIKDLEADRTAQKAPYLKAGQDVDAFYRPARTALQDVDRMIRNRLAEASLARENARRLAVESAAAAARAGDAVAANAALVAQPAEVQLDGISDRFTWAATSYNVRAMPLEYLCVDETKVKAEIDSALRAGRDPAITGVTFERRATVVVRSFDKKER